MEFHPYIRKKKNWKKQKQTKHETIAICEGTYTDQEIIMTKHAQI